MPQRGCESIERERTLTSVKSVFQGALQYMFNVLKSMFSLTSTSRTPAVEFPAELSNSGTSSTLPVSFICCSLKNHFIVLYEEKSSMDQYTLLR